MTEKESDRVGTPPGAHPDGRFDDHEANVHLAAIIASSDDAISSADAGLIVRTWNAAATRLYGYEADEIIGHPVDVLLAPERADGDRPQFARALAGERIEHFEAQRRRKDGTTVEVSVSLSPIRDATGRIVGVASIARDITEFKRVQRRVAAAAAVSHALSEAHLDEATMLSVIVREISVSLGESCVIGLKGPDGSIGTTRYHHEDPSAVSLLRTIVTPTSFALDVGIVGEVLRHGRVIRLSDIDPGQLRSLAHERMWPYLERYPISALLVAPIRYEGEILGVMVVTHDRPELRFDEQDELFAVDLAERTGLAVANARLYRAARDEITQRVAAETSLRESEERFRRIAESAPVVIYRYRLDGQPGFEYVSPTLQQVLGYEPEDLYRNQGLLFGSTDPGGLAAAVALGENPSAETASFVSQRRHRDGRQVWIETRAVLVRDGDGAVVAVEGVAVDITAIRDAESELVRQASHDELTGLPNQLVFRDHVNLALAARSGQQASVAVFFLDLDRFKVINDSLGHALGDAVLREAAERLRHAAGPTDVVARLGGDEFAMLVVGTGAADGARQLADRVLAAFRQPFAVDRRWVHSTMSIGIAVSGDNNSDVGSDLMRHADAALFLAKEAGRDRYEVFDVRLRSRLHDRLQLETELRLALELGQLVAYYQPIVHLASRQVVGVELLVRWQHPTRGLLEATEFIGAAEDCGVIGQLGAWVLDEACRQHRTWRDRGVGVTISVNLSARQLNRPDAQDLESFLVGLAEPSGLCLEITESALMNDVDRSLEQLAALKAMGVQLAIDDFGTGYSSLSYLQRFPIDAVKIDKSFIDGLGTDTQDTRIVSAIVSLARALDLRTIAEGVETNDQLEALMALGCDEAQGFLLGLPMPIEDFESLLVSM